MAHTPTGRPAGRPPKPTEQKRAAGNPGRRELPDAPGVGAGLSSTGEPPAPPESLGVHGLEQWHRVWSAGRSWLSPDVDRAVIENLCHATNEAELLRIDLENGTTPRWYTMANGAEVTHPAVTQLRELRTQMTAWLSMLGFSPADRSRLGLSEVRVRDALEELRDDQQTRRDELAERRNRAG